MLQSDFIFYLTKQVVLKTENNIKEIPTKVHSEKVKLICCGCVQNHGTEPSIFLLRRDGLLTLMVLWGGNENLIEILMKHEQEEAKTNATKWKNNKS